MVRVMTQRLDRDYPLWEYWLVEGVSQGRWALISKVHHCMVDGVSGTDLYRVIFDTSPEPPPPLPAVDDQPVPSEPSGAELAARAALNAALISVQEGGAIQRLVANLSSPYARRPTRCAALLDTPAHCRRRPPHR